MTEDLYDRINTRFDQTSPHFPDDEQTDLWWVIFWLEVLKAKDAL